MCSDKVSWEIPSALLLFVVVACYLLTGGRISIALVLIVGYIVAKKNLKTQESTESGEKKKKKGCCGGKGGPSCCSNKAGLDESLPKKKACCGGLCHSKQVKDPTPAIEIAYDNEIDFTESFKTTST